MISLLFGVFLLVERHGFARDFARSQRRWQGWLGVNLGGQREEEQKVFLVVMGVVLIVVGIVLILVGVVG